MQALSGNRVHLDLLDTEAEAAMGHIELARWADLVMIAPATADFIARIVHGHADNILSTLVLATSAPIAIAPAMNQAMWADDGTQANLQAQKERQFYIFGPGEGDQACGDVGLGRMLEPVELINLCAGLFEAGFLAGKKFIITGGPTQEALEPVRFISNRSSGKMAYALAEEAVGFGAQVILISGPVNIVTPDRVRRIDVVTASEMLAATLANIDNADVFISVAAVADYRPREIAPQKIKKKDKELQLTLVRNPDVISEVAKLEHRPLVVGFAAETTDILENGRKKLKQKNLDLLFANNVSASVDSETIAVTAISKDQEQELPESNKNVVARKMLQLVAAHLDTAA